MSSVNKVSKRPPELTNIILKKDFFGNEYYLSLPNNILYVKFYTFNNWIIISNLFDDSIDNNDYIQKVSNDIQYLIKTKYNYLTDVLQIFQKEGLI